MKTIITPFIAITLLLSMLTGTSQAAAFSNYQNIQDTLNAEVIVEETPSYESFPDMVQQKEESKRGDTTFISIANKNIQIIEKDGETEVKIKNSNDDKFEEEFDEEFEYKEKKKAGEFKGHWAGMEFGLNNFVDNDLSLSRSSESAFLDLNTGKSWNINLNFTQYSLGFGTDHVGLVTGMGLEWSNYHFNDTNSIQEIDGDVEARLIPNNTKKNRLQTTYLTVPMILEFQFLKDNERAYFGLGVIGGVKLLSNTKIKYVENGRKQKEKVKDDFYLSPFRYALTARLGYKALKLYMNYYPTPLFMADKGPEELHPMALGLVMSF